ncbi:hypothetical protein PsalMR5_02791 [Piscirickettsia salmonis]|nr:hypothetical protein PsalSR1_02790 [Piscirickettsia salmonis]QGP58795.1 hypothetical protein PsalBI1_01376 [Piscirickettsia salmonis]QGP64911.1 hypothetical protein PsalMR5_02791 [Piscirickettsia salmonis]
MVFRVIDEASLIKVIDNDLLGTRKHDQAVSALTF